MGGISVSEAQLPAFMVESLFYGMYLITFVACLQRLLLNKPEENWKRLRDINFPMLTIVLLLFFTSTLNLVLALVRNIETYVYQGDENGRISAVDAAWVSNIFKPSLVVFQFLLADSVLIYRCWLVWNRHLIAVLLPLACWIGALITGVYSAYLQVVLEAGLERVFTANFFLLYVAFLICTILLNIYSTSMIVWKIWSLEKAWRPPTICSLRHIPQRGRLSVAKRVIVESGLLYTSTTVIVFITQVCKSNAMLITSAADIQITGIAFNLILARVAVPDRGDSLPFSRMNGCTTTSERGTVDVAVMTTGNSRESVPLDR